MLNRNFTWAAIMLSPMIAHLNRSVGSLLRNDCISLAARGQQVAVRLHRTGCATFAIRPDLDQPSFLDEEPNHGHDRRGLGVQSAADL